MSLILILRPQPGADETAARARAIGLEAVIAPLFEVRALPWEPPASGFDAILLTSANAARHAGKRFDLPCYAVGEATAAAAGDAGYTDVRTGPSDGAALLDEMVRDGVRSALHLCGRDHLAIAHPELRIERRMVYAAEAVGELPREALARGALVLLHSARAAALFASLVEERRTLRLAAISPAVAAAAGPGWGSISCASAPRDEALLELAVRLCHIPPPEAAAARG